jgi:putative DNA primase/helicase
VAFDAGNLANVAKALRKLYPAALLVLCGDDDKATEARTGSNPGRLKAEAAARAVRGLAVFPAPLPENGSDFNDLHQAAGLDAVRACIEGAIEAHQASASAAHAAQADRQGNPSHGPRHAPHGGDDGHDMLVGAPTRSPAAPSTRSRLTMPGCGIAVSTRTAKPRPPNGCAAVWTWKP